MSKPIKLTEELLRKIQEEFVAKVKAMKMLDGELKYTKSFKWEDSENDRAAICFSPVAFAKISSLIRQFSSEVAWHGVVERDAEHPNLFRITDILVFPQLVTGVTVDTDQVAYQDWCYSFDDEVFDHLRMHGHSHVNMPVSPSSTDETHQGNILKQIRDDDFYIFMIWNKSYQHFVRIFDMKTNTLYETDDVDVYIGDEIIDTQPFMAEAKKLVVNEVHTPFAHTVSTPAYTSVTATTAKIKPKKKDSGAKPASQTPTVLADNDGYYYPYFGSGYCGGFYT